MMMIRCLIYKTRDTELKRASNDDDKVNLVWERRMLQYKNSCFVKV